MLKKKKEGIKETCVIKGKLNSEIVQKSEIFSMAVREKANEIIAVHKQPTGDVTP